jgi:hypothetical protein
MRWLVRLVTPPGGLILEPFAGSGTTVEAAILEGFRCIAIEREPDYLPLIVQRVNRRRDPVAYITAAGEDLGLFAEDESWRVAPDAPKSSLGSGSFLLDGCSTVEELRALAAVDAKTPYGRNARSTLARWEKARNVTAEPSSPELRAIASRARGDWDAERSARDELAIAERRNPDEDGDAA